MSVHLPLKEMTLREKLEVLEDLWEDLARNAQNLESPDWHNEALEGRSRRVAEGQARFTDWKTAKAAIRTKLP